jgi:hypothetical protein
MKLSFRGQEAVSGLGLVFHREGFMFFYRKSGRRLMAVALVTTFFLAVPAQAAGGREGSSGFFELITRVADTLDGWIQGTFASMNGSGAPVDHEGGYIDPNGGGRTGSCNEPAGCEGPQPTTPGSPS